RTEDVQADGLAAVPGRLLLGGLEESSAVALPAVLLVDLDVVDPRLTGTPVERHPDHAYRLAAWGAGHEQEHPGAVRSCGQQIVDLPGGQRRRSAARRTGQ